MLVQVIEQLVDVHGTVCVGVPFFGVEFEELDIAQLVALLLSSALGLAHFQAAQSTGGVQGCGGRGLTSRRLLQCSDKKPCKLLYRSAPCKLAPPRAPAPKVVTCGLFWVQKS